MSDTSIVVIVVGIVAIMLLLLFRRRLTRFALDLRKGRVHADTNRNKPPPTRGARQREVDANGNVTARDETGVRASQENVKSGGDVTAAVAQSRQAKLVNERQGDESSANRALSLLDRPRGTSTLPVPQ
jgi:hypothetical protein